MSRRGPARRWTLRRRLVAVVIGVFAVVAGTMGAVSTLALRGTLVEQLDQRLVASSQRAENAQRVQDDAGDPPLSDGSRMSPPPGLDVPGQGAGTLTLEVRDGVTSSAYIDDAGDFQSLTAAQQDALLAVAADGTPRTVSLEDLGEYRVIAVTNDSGDLLVTGLSTSESTATVRSYLLGEAVIVALGVAVAALAGTGLVRRELRPLERVAATATLVSEQPLERGEVTLERVPAPDTDPTTEVGQVGAALNRLLGHVEGALAARHESEMQVRQFVADASHELRTPLASIR
ncbi:MAG: HAMP domain-containing protein, partial [Cellulomonadaceae bacterium]|nr:HAMP domain-containing protein [Cellulomonadaceae bacterium]